MFSRPVNRIPRMSDRRIDRPIFIVGCGRSGTTLLFDIISQHPDVSRSTGYPDGEDHDGWIRYGNCPMSGIGNRASDVYGSGINGRHYCPHLDSSDLTNETVDLMRNYVFDAISKGGGKRFLNKQPHLSNKIDYLLGIFPDAKIIHIVRECRLVVASWIMVMRQHESLMAYLPEEKYPCLWLFERPVRAEEISCLKRNKRFSIGDEKRMWVDYWCKVNMGIASQMMRRLHQLCVVRYEDLLRDPESLMGAINEFLDLDEYSYDFRNIDRGRSGIHEDVLTSAYEDRISSISRDVMRYFGYERRRLFSGVHPRLVSP